MQSFLFNTYQLFSILFFLLISTLLIYNRLFKRWIRFSFGFFVVYLLGSYFFFEKLPIPIARETFQALPYFLFFFGTFACIGYCLIAQLSFGQSVGILFCYFFLLSGFVALSGSVIGVDLRLPGKGAIEEFLVSLPYILFYAGSPMVLGFFLYRGMSLKETVGAYMAFGSFLLLIIVATTNYFDRPFGFFYELGLYARAWIEVLSIWALILGVPAVIGYCLLNSLTFKESLGTLLTFLAVMAAVIVIINLTIGYEYLGQSSGQW